MYNRQQEGSVTLTIGQESITLTPRQLEFMERLSECPGWPILGLTGEYITSEYAEELSDTMSSMAVGAVLTTLQEKGLVHTEKRRAGAIKVCLFRLTDLGARVYKKLSTKEEKHG